MIRIDMKRRSFIKQLGLSTPLILGNQHYPTKSINKYQYPEIDSLEDAFTKEGQIMVRLATYSKTPFEVSALSGKIRIKKGKLARKKAYFFEAEEDQLSANDQFQMHTSLDHCDVIVLWLDEANKDTEILLQLENQSALSCTLQEIVEAKTLYKEQGNSKVQLNLLLDKEIGEIDPSEVGIKAQSSDFSIAIMADTQGGDPYAEGGEEPKNDSTTRMKIHNAFVEDSVRVVNELEETPLFTIVVGDIVDSKGQWFNYRVMLDYLKKLKTPLLFSVGNHETAYRIDLEPGYNMQGFSNYFTAQKEANGLDKLLYSFNLGEWHFVVWPDPLRSNFWETHPHYFDWLERDLEKYKDKPVMFFHHVPLMPIGINPLINYAESVDVKRQVIDILAKHDNVQYALSGHVHIPLKASVKTAVNYKGIRFINLPAAGYRPRAFGEADFYGDPAQGVALAHFSGKNVQLQYKNVTNQIYDYPNDFRAFDTETYPLWLKHKWELPTHASLQNGDFRQGLAHWHRRFVYTEDQNPSNICEVRNNVRKGSATTLYMLSKKRGFDIPGQDRLPQTINRICNVVSVEKNQHYLLELAAMLDGKNTTPNSFNAAYIWIEGYAKNYKRLNLVYSCGKMYFNIGGKHAESGTVKPIHFNLALSPDKWHNIAINIAKDHNANVPERPYEQLGIDRLVINLGTWTVNDSNFAKGEAQQVAAFFDKLSLNSVRDNDQASLLDQTPIALKDGDDFWYGGIDHIAGEHIYKT